MRNLPACFAMTWLLLGSTAHSTSIGVGLKALFREDGEGWIKTNESIWHTVDSGDTWENLTPDLRNLWDGARPVSFADIGMLQGSGIRILTSDCSVLSQQDAGRSWTIHRPASALKPLTRCTELAAGGPAVVALGGSEPTRPLDPKGPPFLVIWRDIDRPAEIVQLPFKNARQLRWSDSDELLVFADNAIVSSDDVGNTWKPMFTFDEEIDVFDLLIETSGDVYVLDHLRRIWRLTPERRFLQVGMPDELAQEPMGVAPIDRLVSVREGEALVQGSEGIMLETRVYKSCLFSVSMRDGSLATSFAADRKVVYATQSGSTTWLILYPRSSSVTEEGLTILVSHDAGLTWTDPRATPNSH